MKNNQIGKILKRYRKINSLTVPDVVVELEKNFGVTVAEKTVYGWESNQAHPTSDMLIALCDIYKITSVTEVFAPSGQAKGFPITQEERRLVQQYRKNPDLHAVIQKLLDMNEDI